MRPAIALGAMASIAFLCLGIIVGGRQISDAESASISVDQIDPEMMDMLEPDAEAPADEPDSGAAVEQPEAETQPSPETTAGYQRVGPRKPLSEISQPPPPKRPDDWEGTTLYRPVADTAGTFEAMGYAVTIAGTDTVSAGEVCDFKGERWPCGVRARAAFRAFLRGRAVTCAVPPGAASGAVTAECRVGKQNVGEWLVENGWARAAPGGPFAELGQKTQSAAKGIFGPPPSTAGLPPAATPVPAEPAVIPELPAQ